MLTEPLIQQLHSLKLFGLAAGLEQQLVAPDTQRLSFEERFGLLLQHEAAARASARLTQRLHWARLPQPACLEDLDTRTPHGLDPALLARLADLSWIRQHLNVLITGPCGVGKSFVACALTLADAILDRTVHNAYRLNLTGESMRKRKSIPQTGSPTSQAA
ncbi:MAG: ATP-binding protein [Gammaproteobacteria bacterium]